jgi:Mrp family chromosome partitioning ATPase
LHQAPGRRARQVDGRRLPLPACRRSISPQTTPPPDFAMSALDQAFIKAYAKDPAADSAPVAVVASVPMRPTAATARRASAHQVEQLYHDGALYRVETPRVAGRAAVVPQPHGAMLPPTSPRRTVRRSVLRLLANQAATGLPELPPGPPQRVARKVIIRHISHSATPAPLGRLRSTLTQSFAAEPEALYAPEPRPSPKPAAELPPETIADEPPAAAPLPALPSPATAAPIVSPNTAPLNVALDEVPQFAVQGYWKQGEPAPATLVVADAVHLPEIDSAPLVTVSLDSLIAAEVAIRQHRAADNAVAAEPAMTRFAAKALDDHDQSQVTFRVDAEHPQPAPRPHARFRPAEEQEETLVTLPPPAVQAPPTEQAPVEIEQSAEAPTVQEVAYVEAEAIDELATAPEAALDLTFAEPLAGRSPDDLMLLDSEPADEATLLDDEDPPSAAKQSPLWEIDRFQWPRTCQKLFADEHSYLAHASGKLLAAVQDGLKVLAITGSRRGEGRSTLALCLARSAAQAGIQVAVMDADFARPQLASKIGLEIAYGWQDAALGKVPLSEAAVKSLADNITVLPLETSAAGRSLSLADPRVTATVRAAAATFELLILDLGPIGPGEALAFPPGERCPLDAAIVVRDLRFATAAESEAIGQGLQDAGVEAVGIAENFAVEEELPVTSV